MRLIIHLEEGICLDSTTAKDLIEISRKAALYQQRREDGGTSVALVKQKGDIELAAYAENTKTGFSARTYSNAKTQGAIAQ